MPGGNSLEANIGRVFDPKEWCQGDLTRWNGVKASCWEWAGTIVQVPGILLVYM
jgi:hypothetical protein